MKTLVLLFIGALIAVFLKMRVSVVKQSSVYPSTTAPVSDDCFDITLGFHYVRTCNPRDCLRGVPFESYNEAIPLSTDYLYGAPGHSAAISPTNLATDCRTINNWKQLYRKGTISKPVGITGPCTIPLGYGGGISFCKHPEIPDIPTTEVV